MLPDFISEIFFFLKLFGLDWFGVFIVWVNLVNYLVSF